MLAHRITVVLILLKGQIKSAYPALSRSICSSAVGYFPVTCEQCPARQVELNEDGIDVCCVGAALWLNTPRKRYDSNSYKYFLFEIEVSSTAGSMPSEYVRCRNFMDGIDQMEEDDSVSSELEKGNREF